MQRQDQRLERALRVHMVWNIGHNKFSLRLTISVARQVPRSEA
jgi:chromosome condensin MukBEF MukE localization factor